MIESRMEVRRYRRHSEFGSKQRLERVYSLFGIDVLRVSIDEEDVPAWAEIQLGALGYTDWRSSFAEFIK